MTTRRPCLYPVLILITLLSPLAEATPLADQYVFVPDTSRYVGVVCSDGAIMVGSLDTDGEFQCRRVIPYGGQISGPPIPGVLLNLTDKHVQAGQVPSCPAYEYRSGMLIKGTLLKKGHHFVPEVGSHVIPFKEYKYSPDAPIIWNLPGRWEKKEPK